MKTNYKISKTFVGFLIASVLIWLLITFSKEYTTTIVLPISYGALPQNKLLQSPPKKEVVAFVKGTGFKILSRKFKSKEIQIATQNLSKKSHNRYYLLINNQKVTIQKQLDPGLKLDHFLEDTIHLNLGSLSSKKTPVKPRLNIDYHIGYENSKDIELEPDSITISGPEDLIKNIKHVGLKLLNLEDVKSDFSKTIAIEKPLNSDQLHFSSEYVKIKGTVEKITEGSVELPFVVTNVPKDIQLTTFPKVVKIVYKIGLSNFSKVDENSFQIECDYRVSEKNKYPYLIPTLVKTSNFVKSVKIIPNKIDFLIQK